MDGGAELGRGYNGAVIDIVNPRDAADKRTLVHMLGPTAGGDGPSAQWVVHTIGSGSSRSGSSRTRAGAGVKEWKVTTASAKADVLAALGRATDFVAKITLERPNFSQKDVFAKELHATTTILRAYGATGAAKHVAVEPVPLPEGRAIAIVVPALKLYVIFNRRCGSTLDNAVLDSDATCKAMVLQLLTSLSLLHASGWIHTDIKPDNIIVCSSSSSSRSSSRSSSSSRSRAKKQFKLIDWGGAMQYTDPGGLKDVFTLAAVMRTRSPIAWFVAGSPATVAVAASKLLLTVLYKKQALGSAPLSVAIDAMTAGFSRYVGARAAHAAFAVAVAGAGAVPKRAAIPAIPAAMAPDDAVRCAIMADKLPCIDTASLGLALAAVVFEPRHKLSRGATDRLRTFLHERMLVMDHPRYVGHSAAPLLEKARAEL